MGDFVLEAVLHQRGYLPGEIEKLREQISRTETALMEYGSTLADLLERQRQLDEFIAARRHWGKGE